MAATHAFFSGRNRDGFGTNDAPCVSVQSKCLADSPLASRFMAHLPNHALAWFTLVLVWTDLDTHRKWARCCTHLHWRRSIGRSDVPIWRINDHPHIDGMLVALFRIGKAYGFTEILNRTCGGFRSKSASIL